MNNAYIGLNNDHHGITRLGRMQMLMDKVSAECDKYSNLPCRLPAALQHRHTDIYAAAMINARAKGWAPELGDEE